MSYQPKNPNGQAAMANSQPVALASDQSSIPVAATLSAETTKAIGVIRNSDGAGNLLTSNSTTTISKFGLDTNILSILGTAPTTAGKLDIKGADGDVFVRQSIATNLKTQANMYDGSGNAITSNSTTTTSNRGLDLNLLSILGTAPTTAGKMDIKAADGDVFIRQSTASNLNAQVVGNVAIGASNSGNPVLDGLIYESSPTVLSSGQRGALHGDTNQNLFVTLATLIAGEDLTNSVMKVEQRFSYSNITSNTTTTVKSSSGFIHCITINTHGASANTATVYDNTAGSGTKIGTIDTTSGDGKLFDVSFVNGLTIVTATGTAADITVSYR